MKENKKDFPIPKVGQRCMVKGFEHIVIKFEGGIVTVSGIISMQESSLFLGKLIEQIDEEGFYDVSSTGGSELTEAEEKERAEMIEVENEKIPKKKLTLKQKLFCKYYVSDATCGSGVKSYIKAYKSDYETAKNRASRLLSDIHIYTHINSLLDKAGFSQENADKQLLSLMNQHDDKHVKVRSLDLFYKVTKRINSGVIINNITLTKEEQEEIDDLLDDNLDV